jgi:thymidine kinase
MSRPEFVSNEDLDRWSEVIDNDERIPKHVAQAVLIREVCYAGLYLVEQLEKLNCPDDLSVRIQWQGGKASFGRDPWEVHQKLLEDYIDNKLLFEDDPTVDMN